MMPKEPKKKKPKIEVQSKGETVAIGMIQLENKVDGLQNLLGNAMATIQRLEQRLNENWTKFVFHDHRRVDSSGPQYYNTEYEQAYLKEQDRQAAIKRAQQPPVPKPEEESPAKSDEK